jgi:hypothetical protein
MSALVVLNIRTFLLDALVIWKRLHLEDLYGATREDGLPFTLELPASGAAGVLHLPLPPSIRETGNCAKRTAQQRWCFSKLGLECSTPAALGTNIKICRVNNRTHIPRTIFAQIAIDSRAAIFSETFLYLARYLHRDSFAISNSTDSTSAQAGL